MRLVRGVSTANINAEKKLLEFSRFGAAPVNYLSYRNVSILFIIQIVSLGPPCFPRQLNDGPGRAKNKMLRNIRMMQFTSPSLLSTTFLPFLSFTPSALPLIGMSPIGPQC
ncbi:hypothetical protein TNIN_439421 [Trichonephila inaurata madagascariensis]|uniref:Uncharacterized protein n=1 Tax=Trichonephila inaurata madagascariensis TaxID=2747483 RepID=A0A8X6YFY1_9ARAC|nr:hypothetical protein TNIN_439421 [Trichonephila inaurata madagascariensis]